MFPLPLWERDRERDGLYTQIKVCKIKDFKNINREQRMSEKQNLFKKVFTFIVLLIWVGFMTQMAYAMGQTGGSGQGGGITAFLPLILIVVVFYFLLIRPQQKRQKEQKMMISALRKGDKVVTNSGMFGTIVGIDDQENKVVLKVAENVKIEFLKSSIAGRVGTEE
jgi:preprotein translocase subunit YajC